MIYIYIMIEILLHIFVFQPTLDSLNDVLFL